ncbi:MAG: amidohydrolase [Deltaproteobacteria bacterium]|nr:amidohydrolase [Deltaproteobacteria bacterium]
MYKIIDIHTHIFPDEIAHKTMRYLEEEANTKAYLDGTISNLKNSMKKANISISVNQPISTKPSQVQSINNWAKQIQNDEVISFGTIHPKYEGFKDEIKRLKELGIKGVKLHPDYQEFHPDDESMFPIYECLAENDIIILFHAGIDIGRYPPVYGTPQTLANVIDNFPDLKIIASHMGGYKLWDDVEKYLVGREIYFDTSYVIDYMDTERFVKIMENHGFDKILFATDSPWKDQADEVKKISALDIPEKAKEDVFWRNANRLCEIF